MHNDEANKARLYTAALEGRVRAAEEALERFRVALSTIFLLDPDSNAGKIAEDALTRG